MNEDGSTRVNRLCRSKVAAFEKRGLEFFEQSFPGAVRHLRLDLDEEAPHFHAVLMQTETKTTKSRGRQVLLRPAANPLLKDYELAQDVAGDFFAPIGLVRGMRGKAARRDARESGLPSPEPVRHTSPRAHREARLARIRQAEDAARGSREAAESALLDAEAARATAMSDAAATRLAAKGQAEEEARRIEAQARAAGEKTRAEAEARAEALIAAVETGLDALLAGELEYVPPTEEKRDTIRQGHTARPGSAFDALIARIKPAGRRMVRLARKVFELQQRGRALDARADAQTRDARALDDTRRLIGAEPDRRLQTLATRPLAVGYRPEALPGAWAVAADRHDTRTVQAALDQMTNVELRRTLSATRDGVRICEDEPVLRKDLGRAAKLLEFAAGQRGYDPEADTHDPRRATDPSRARMHTDTESLRIHVTRRDRQRQRVRGE